MGNRSNETVVVGNLFCDGDLAVECDGFHDLMGRNTPHENWALVGVHGDGEHVQLAPFVEKAILGHRFEHLDPVMAITESGKRVYVVTKSPNFLFRNELKTPGLYQPVSDRIMPESLARVLSHVGRYNPDPVDLSNIDWLTQHFVRSRQRWHWDEGCKKKPELTVRQLREVCNEEFWNPAIDEDLDWNTVGPKLYAHVQAALDTAIAEHGPDYPARNLLIR